MIELYPPIEPYDHGMLDVGDGNTIAWEVCGAPDGKPAVVVHGGPGQGCTPNMRRAFDPKRYRVVLFDQRGCGRSLPHASVPTTNMALNTTDHLITDMEILRQRLRIQRWLVMGGSWGSALALAYAQRHPERVSEIVLSGVTTARRSEAEWLYGGLARFFPEAWERFRDHIPEAERGDGLTAAYAARMENAQSAVRCAAAQAWCDWEDAVMLLEPHVAAGTYADMPERDRLAFVRICSRYVSHGAWLEEGSLIRNAGRLAAIPGVLIHGRRDLTCPIDTAWALAHAWHGAALVAIDEAGHGRSEAKRAAVLRALDNFASQT